MSPTLVIVTGSFAPASLYTEFVAVLKKHGVDTVVLSSPSVGRREGKPAASMMEDADEIVRAVSELLDAGKEVVLLAHSYGGIPAAQSMERLSVKQRTAAGKKGGVAKMVYLTAIALPLGGSNMDSFNPESASHLMKSDVSLRPCDLRQGRVRRELMGTPRERERDKKTDKLTNIQT